MGFIGNFFVGKTCNLVHPFIGSLARSNRINGISYIACMPHAIVRIVLNDSAPSSFLVVIFTSRTFITH